MRQHTFPRIPELLRRARAAGIEWPKIRLTTDGGRKIVLAMAGGQSSRPGWVRVTDGAKYGSGGKFWGWLEPDGRWYPSQGTADVEDALSRLDADPAAAAALQGRLTGSCCFCGRHLDAAESVGVGYGPRCAEKVGLPWGHTQPYAELHERVSEEVLS